MITGTVILKHEVTGVIPVYNDGGNPSTDGFFLLIDEINYLLIDSTNKLLIQSVPYNLLIDETNSLLIDSTNKLNL